MWTARRPSTTNENMYGNQGPSISKPNPSSSASSGKSEGGGGPLPTKKGLVARKALGQLSTNQQSSAAPLEEQALIKQGKAKLVAPKPRRALGEITNRIGINPDVQGNKGPAAAGGGKGSGLLMMKKPVPPSASRSAGGFAVHAPPLSMFESTAAASMKVSVADISFSSDDDEVELSAGRLGDEEDALVAKKRMVREAFEEEIFHWSWTNWAAEKEMFHMELDQFYMPGGKGGAGRGGSPFGNEEDDREFEDQIKGLMINDLKDLLGSVDEGLLQEGNNDDEQGATGGTGGGHEGEEEQGMVNYGPVLDDLDLDFSIDQKMNK